RSSSRMSPQIFSVGSIEGPTATTNEHTWFRKRCMAHAPCSVKIATLDPRTRLAGIPEQAKNKSQKKKKRTKTENFGGTRGTTESDSREAWRGHGVQVRLESMDIVCRGSVDDDGVRHAVPFFAVRADREGRAG